MWNEGSNATEINKGARISDFVSRRAEIVAGQASAREAIKATSKSELCPKETGISQTSNAELATTLGYAQESDSICGTHSSTALLRGARERGEIYDGFLADYASEIDAGRHTARFAAKDEGVTKYCREDRVREREDDEAQEVYRAVGLH
jgi:hypothetical protein